MTMNSEACPHTLDLIERIYDAVEDQARWPAFLGALCDALQSSHGFLVLHVPGKGLDHQLVSEAMQVGCTYGWTDEQIQLYLQRYAILDPWAANMDAHEEGTVYRGSDICADDKFYSSVVYREFYGPNGCHHGCGTFIKRTSSGMSFLTMIRSAASGAYTDPELSVLRRLLPHLQRAARLFGELVFLRSQLEAVRGVMDLSPQGFLQVDPSGKVIFANQAACRDETLALASGRVQINARNGDRAFQDAIRGVLGDRPRLRRLDVERAGDGKRCRILLIRDPKPVSATHRADAPTVSVLVIDESSAQKPDPSVLAELFSLTLAEARVAASLVSGLSVQEIAAELRITRETVRTHLRRILSKTNTRRQGELISLVHRSVPFPNVQV
jgi:DNA-binding CsgD family transcriptional regulator/PAS domain-containing protein